jgi:hypothetical protein
MIWAVSAVASITSSLKLAAPDARVYDTCMNVAFVVRVAAAIIRGALFPGGAVARVGQGNGGA